MLPSKCLFSCQVPHGCHTDLGQSPARTLNNHLLLQSIPGTFKTSITKLQHCKWFLYRPYLRNCYLVSRARDTWLIRSQMARKLIFCGGRKTGEKQSESHWDQPITAHVRAQDRTQVKVLGGECHDHSPANESIGISHHVSEIIQRIITVADLHLLVCRFLEQLPQSGWEVSSHTSNLRMK